MNNRAAPPSARIITGLVAIALGLPTVVALVVTVWRPAHGSWGLVAALAALSALCLVAARRAGPRGARVLLAVASVVVVLVWPEVGLRAVGFRWDHAGWVVFGLVHPDQMIAARQDPDLFWTLPPEEDGVNSHGFLGGEFVIPKPAGDYRMVFLGDSCTMQGFPAIVGRMLGLLGSSERSYEPINLGVAGYSSYQGRVLARRWLAKLRPDLVVVYFGWNDHWRAHVATDAERSRWYRRLWTELLSSSRLFQATVWAGGPRPPRIIDRPRVSLPEYRANLEAIHESASETGANVLFLTAPSNQGRHGVPDYLIENGFAPSKEVALAEHRQYNREVVRMTGEHGWRLLDLAREVEDGSAPDGIFLQDGIHFTEKGLNWIASRVVQEVVEQESSRTTAP